MDGNSIYICAKITINWLVVVIYRNSKTRKSRTRHDSPIPKKTKTGQVACETYQAFVWGQQHCDSRVDLTDGQGDKHGCIEDLTMKIEREKKDARGRDGSSAQGVAVKERLWRLWLGDR